MMHETYFTYMILYMISYDIIHDIMMSTLTVHALQPPILPRHSVLMQPTTITNLTDQWNFDEVTLLIKAL